MFGHGWYFFDFLFSGSCLRPLVSFFPTFHQKSPGQKKKKGMWRSYNEGVQQVEPPMYDMPAKDSKGDHGQGWDKNKMIFV